MDKSKVKNTLIIGACFVTLSATVVLGSKDVKTGEYDSNTQIVQYKTEITEEEKEADIILVKNLIEDFGEKLKMVSLLAPEDILNESMEENYGEFLSHTLLEEWKENPQKALGRLTSSPWPERIEILDTKKVSEVKYEVKGEVIEVTSSETKDDGIVERQLIILLAIKEDDNWVIDDVTIDEITNDVKIDANVETSKVVYRNTEYNFEFSLPKSWNKYEIINDKWEGIYIADSRGEKGKETGPMINIRHPEWDEENPRQDIPIMIFKIDQWNLIQNEELSVGAAPIPPSELGRNEEYVFALPARYNYGFLAGYEEVETILESNPLVPMDEDK